MSKAEKKARKKAAKAASQPQPPTASVMADALAAANVTPQTVATPATETTSEPQAATTKTVETTTTPEPKPEPTPTEPNAEQLKAIADQIAAAEKKVAEAKAAYDKARADLAGLKKGPKAPDFDADGKPLSAGRKAWLTRVARGFAPKPKAPKPAPDPNAPVTAGRKAWLTRVARQADPNYKPPKAATPKADTSEHMATAIGAAFPTTDAFQGGTRVEMS